MNIDTDHVLTCEGVIMWDGITQPETKDDGTVVHSLKIGISGASLERAELEDLAQRALAASPDFKGLLPPGGEWPVRDIDMSKFADDAATMSGRVSLNANTRLGAPQIFDINGQVLSAMQYGRMLYPGAIVKMLVHSYPFNNKSKGIAFGLDGIQIVDASAPKLAVGGGMAAAAVAAAFAGNVAAPMANPPATPPPNAAFVANAGVPDHVMLPKAAGQTYDALIAAKWTDALLIEHGMMQA